MTDARVRSAPVRRAGIMLGIGLGGFLDGILLHQILQVHAMFSATLPQDTMENMRTNMLGDGLFHAFTWVVTLTGVVWLWNALNRRDGPPPPGRVLAGTMLAGWGWFNLVEGLIDHHILGLHHVVERLGLSVWDWLFLASGVVLIVAGHALARERGARG